MGSSGGNDRQLSTVVLEPAAFRGGQVLGYAQHRLGDDQGAIASLRRSLQLDSDHAEARIYLANILYDQSEFEVAVTLPEGYSLSRADAVLTEIEGVLSVIWEAVVESRRLPSP